MADTTLPAGTVTLLFTDIESSTQLLERLGDAYAEVLFDLVAPQGVVCFLVPPTTPIDLAKLHAKSATLAWELMFTRSRYRTPDMGEQGRILSEVAALMDAGRIRTTMTTCERPIDASTLRRAHARIESGRTIGKIVLEGFEGGPRDARA